MHAPPGVEEVQGRIFADHYFYSETDVSRMLPADTAKIASIRYPLSQMRAAMVEFGHTKMFAKSDPDPVRTYLSDIKRWGPYGLGNVLFPLTYI